MECSWGYGARFRQKFTLEDAIGSHACSLEANKRVTNGIPLESSLLLPVDAVNCVQTLKVSKALGVGMANITVQSRRAGGGFGGKLCRHIPVAVAAAVAAQHTKKPVRMTLDRNTDMRTTGGRHAVDTQFEAGFNNDGKIVALKLDIYMNCGFNPDLSDFCVMSIAKAVDQVYRFDDLEITARACKTNLPTRGAVRGYGARFSTDFTLEDAIARLLASSKHACDQWYSSRMFSSSL
jgi:xanthine dehydrogenase molybdopterin-binding subunit B